jgi:hypothetical protein
LNFFFIKYTAEEEANTDGGLAHLFNLTHLDCFWNENFTEAALKNITTALKNINSK